MFWQFKVMLALFMVVAAGDSGDAGDAIEPRSAGVQLEYEPVDGQVVPFVDVLLRDGMEVIEAYFGQPFQKEVRVRLCSTREAFTRAFPPEWGLTETQCWMVGAGVADQLILLSPRVWNDQACEHDGEDSLHVRDIIVHELVHVFHGQYNPTGDFTGAEEVGWFAEGLAVHVSGQLQRGRLAEAREAIENGQAPTQLAQAWSGKYRYGVAGSLVEYLESRVGRDGLKKMLAVTRESELLALVGLQENEILENWKQFVLGP